MRLLTTDNPKSLKGESRGYLTHILHLAPASLSGFNVCPAASEGCRAACLNTAGMGGVFPSIQAARVRKTRYFFENRTGFMADLIRDIEAGIRKAQRADLVPVFRLNGTSDIRWEIMKVSHNGKIYRNVMEVFPDVMFYDYTALSNRRNLPGNYSLTFSRKESNQANVFKAIENGMNIAVVFDKLPESYLGLSVINGDESDLRFLDPTQVIVGLKAKGKARSDYSGFVVRI